ncbi:hypothetical protein cpu_13840 [Carboxydothermus pertinax]|uniref:Uncharacterized protein n=1 Tax=Carboxydothermus pertinax TaxID=870242 RepID=A0A1L8CVI0_9THEO|nr:hypothetical protein cpu_13840 [Carboxydothermus pertinax]
MKKSGNLSKTTPNLTWDKTGRIFGLFSIYLPYNYHYEDDEKEFFAMVGKYLSFVYLRKETV